MTETNCKKCKELIEKLGINERANYEAVCDDCWDKHVDNSEQEKMDKDERFKKFVKEYEELCKKYEMSHRTYDKWDTGNEEICVYDEKEKQYILDLL